MTFQGSTDTNTFYTYVTQVLVPQLWTGACVVMENFSSHKVTGIKEAIEAVGAKFSRAKSFKTFRSTDL